MAWNLLLTSDIGLLSLFTIGFVLVMAVYIYHYVAQKMKEEDTEHSHFPGGHSHA